MKIEKKTPVTLTLIRGIPGSGKSTLAQKLSRENGDVHLETDMFFVNSDGCYAFNPNQLQQAHHWCKQRVEAVLREGNSVIVSNTFVKLWEMEDYFRIAQRLDSAVYVIECFEEYQSIHNVPVQTVSKMRKNWETINPKSLGRIYKLRHLTLLPANNITD